MSARDRGRSPGRRTSGSWTPPVWAIAFFLSLPLGGLIAYRYLVGTGRLRHQLRFGALLLTRAQEARRLLAERREIVGELERASEYLGTAKGPKLSA